MISLTQSIEALKETRAGGFVRLMLAGQWRAILYRIQIKYRRLDLAMVQPEKLGLSREVAIAYTNSGGPQLKSVLRRIKPSSSDSVLDIGCGKGGAMLTLAESPFSCVDGLEISPDLIRIARVNLQRAGFRKGRVLQGDAAAYVDLDSYTFFYLYNPFTKAIFQPMLENILASRKRRPRKLTLIYMTPVHDELVVGAGFEKVLCSGDPESPINVYVLK